MRPQSAKPGHKGYWGQSSADDINDNSIVNKNGNRKPAKFLMPNLSNNEYGRILPKKIQQDKERLYSEALHLKQNLNNLIEENTRLKTKISILEKEKDKMNKHLETTAEALGNRGNSRINIYSGKAGEKQSMIMRNLKKIVRDTRQQNQTLRLENQRIKQMMKYTKIHENQIEKQVLFDQNRRLSVILEDLIGQVSNLEEAERENEQLKRYLQEELQKDKQHNEDTEKYEEIITRLQDQMRSQADKFQNKERKFVRDLAFEKRKVQESQRHIEQLRRQLKSKQNQVGLEIKRRPGRTIIRPQTNPHRNGKVNTEYSSKQRVDVRQYEQSVELQRKNAELQRELEEVKAKLEKTESQLTTMIAKQRKLNESKIRQVEEESKEFNNYSESKVNNKSQRSEQKLKQSDINFKSSQSKVIEIDDKSQQYEQQFQLNEDNLKTSKDEEEIQKYKRQFQGEDHEELYKQQASSSKKNKEKDSKKKKIRAEVFKPDKKILSEIKELLTYRMKSQRYPFTDLKSDIESSETTTFSHADLSHMLMSEPFYLVPFYAKVFLTYCFQKKNVAAVDTLGHAVLVAKLRKVIDDFELMSEEEEKEMIVRIAEMTSTYPKELQMAFENIKNGEETVAKKDLIEMFQKLQLEDKYIDLIIAELSLCSDDLEHLNFHGYFERFYIEVEDEDMKFDNNAIEEQGQESEESYKNSSRVKKHVNKSSSKSFQKNRRPQKEVNDAEVQIVEDDERI